MASQAPNISDCPLCSQQFTESWHKHIQDHHQDNGVVSCHFPTCSWTTEARRADALYDHWARTHNFYRANDPLRHSLDRKHLTRKTHQVLENAIMDDYDALEAQKTRARLVENDILRYKADYVPGHNLRTAPRMPPHSLKELNKSELVEELCRVRLTLYQDWDGLLVTLRAQLEGLQQQDSD